MLECLSQTNLYKSIGVNKNLKHAYLFHSLDRELNNQIALTFARSLFCANNCGVCDICKQFEMRSLLDLTVIDQQSVKVEDVNSIINKTATKPVSNKYKIFVILNAERINELAQNKLLKTLEEPNSSNIFILTSSKIDGLLPTIISRLTKIYIPKLQTVDQSIILKELSSKGITINNSILDFSLTNILNFSTNDEYISTFNELIKLFTNLSTTQDIPKCVSNLNIKNKEIFFEILMKSFNDVIFNTPNNKQLYEVLSTKFPIKALSNCLPLIDKSYRMCMANVNFGYVLDNLLFNILKEKFLCN